MNIREAAASYLACIQRIAALAAQEGVAALPERSEHRPR